MREKTHEHRVEKKKSTSPAALHETSKLESQSGISIAPPTLQLKENEEEKTEERTSESPTLDFDTEIPNQNPSTQSAPVESILGPENPVAITQRKREEPEPEEEKSEDTSQSYSMDAAAVDPPAEDDQKGNANSSAFQLKEDTIHKSGESRSTSQGAYKANNTGLPDQLKSGVENLSGYSMDDVKVHYNSSKPSQLKAHAYAQGTDIHVASGQEKHVPHEAWHVVQQKQGRVKTTMQMKGGVNVNDDTGLEKEADVMGQKALQKTEHLTPIYPSTTSLNNDAIVQGEFWEKIGTEYVFHKENVDYKIYKRVKGEKKWKSSWLHNLLNKELNVYRKKQAPPEPKKKKKKKKQAVVEYDNDDSANDSEDSAQEFDINAENRIRKQEYQEAKRISKQYKTSKDQYDFDRNRNYVPTNSGGGQQINIDQDKEPVQYRNEQNYLPNGSGPFTEEYFNTGVGATGLYRKITPTTVTNGYAFWAGYNITHPGNMWIRVWNSNLNHWQNWDHGARAGVNFAEHLAHAPNDARSAGQRDLAENGYKELYYDFTSNRFQPQLKERRKKE